MPAPSASEPAVQSVLLTAPHALAQLRAEWRALWSATEPRPPMLDHDWIRHWWRQHERDGELFVLRVEDDSGRVIGLAPLYRRRRVMSPRGWLRAIHFLGTGENERDEVHGEYTTWLTRPEHRAVVSREVGRALLGDRGWDRVELLRLQPEAGIHEVLPAQLASRLCASEITDVATFRSPLQPLEDYLKALSSGSYRHRCRRAIKAGRELGVTFVRAETVGDHQRMFERLRELHQRRWTGRGESGVFASPVFTKFHEGLLPLYAQTGRAWMVAVEQAGKLLAVRYCLRSEDQLFDYVSGVDTEAPTALAPGLLLHLLTIDAAAKAGLRVYDLMGGDQEYKRRLMLVHDRMVTVDLYAKTIASRAWLKAREWRRRRAASVAPAAAEAPAGDD